MSGSFNFLLHLAGFAMVSSSLMAGWTVEGKIRDEQDLTLKRALLRVNRTIGLMTPAASIILLLTGVVNIFGLYPSDPMSWHSEGWLMAKVILFAFLVVNGGVFGPLIGRKRTKLIQDMLDNTASVDADEHLHIYEKNISTFYLVQSLLLLVILYLSVFGGSKHPGLF
jgi:TRAP-type mannitol/chloroaromatic compound transport system permease small subunit